MTDRIKPAPQNARWVYLKKEEVDYWLAKHLGYKPLNQTGDIQISPKQLAKIRTEELKIPRRQQYRYLADCLVHRLHHKFPITWLEAEQEIWEWGNRFYLETGCWVSSEYSCREVMEETFWELSRRKTLKRTNRELEELRQLKLNPKGW